MQKSFSGKQSGIFAATACLIEARLPSEPIHITVQGLNIVSGKPLAHPLRGLYVSGRLDGYIRNITISSWDGRYFTVGCDHGVEEDIGATEIRFTYYPRVTLSDAIGRFSENTTDASLQEGLADIIISLDNLDPEHQRILATFLSSSKNLLSHPSPHVRRMFTLLAKQSQVGGARHIILRTLEDTDDSVKEMSLMNLEGYSNLLKRHSIENLLLDSLQSSNRNIRAYACEDLAAYGSLQALAHLYQMALDVDNHVREAALIAIYRLIVEKGVSLGSPLRKKIIRLCSEVIAEAEHYVLKAAALRLLFEVDDKNRAAVEEAFKYLSGDIDLVADETTFKAQLFYRNNLWSLLLERTKWLAEHKEYAASLDRVIRKLTEDIRHLYEQQREAYWCSYLRTYLPPPKKVKGQVFVNYSHSSAAFEIALKDIEPELSTRGIKLFISKDRNPFWSENVFIPKVYRPIQESEFMLIEISKPNLNVGYELGLAEKFNLPLALVMSEQARDVAFDLTGHYIHLVYDEDSSDGMLRFKEALLDHLTKAFEGIRSRSAM